MKRYLTETIGAFFYALVWGISANPFALAALVFLLMIFFFRVSGAQFNPAISLGLFLKKDISAMEFICLSFFQVLGVALAVFLFYLLFGRTYVLQPQQHINIIKPFSLEILFSGLIVFSYLHGKRFSKHPESNPAVMVGIAILVSVLTTASISGGCFNPALGLGPVIPELLYKSGYNIHHIWIYVWGPIIGSVLAFIADKILTSPGNE